MPQNGLAGILRPRLGVVVTTWSGEDGVDYARSLPALFPGTAPADQVECVVSPRLLEGEDDIPAIKAYFADKGIDLLLMIPGNFTLDHVMPMMAEAMAMPSMESIDLMGFCVMWRRIMRLGADIQRFTPRRSMKVWR